MRKEYFIFIQGQRIVVSKEVYLAYWQDRNHEKHLIRRDIKNKVLCFSDFSEHVINSVADESVDLEKIIETRFRAEKLREALATLNKEERAIVEALYFNEETTRGAAKIFGLHQTSLIRKRDRILKKLKEILQNTI